MNNKEKTKNFTEGEFDQKVSNSIHDINIRSKLKYINKKYNEWCDNNIIHLKYMYNLSNLDCEFNSFCIYVFNNSEIV